MYENNGSYASQSTGLPLPPEGSTIVLGDDGRYHWRGFVEMRENPTILLLLLKIFGVIGVCLLAITVGIVVVSGNFDLGAILWLVSIVAGVFAFCVLLMLVIYWLYATYMDWVYAADYEMDETGLLFKRTEKDARLMRKIVAANAFVGVATGRYGLTVSSIAASGNDAASVFKSVRRVKGIRKHGCIKVSQITLYNQVYVAPQDYDFVLWFISTHCPKAKVVQA